MTDEIGSPFMRLPTEIREMILRYLLVTQYTAVEHRMKSKEYHEKRSYLRNGPDQTYHFSTAIMRTNHIIYAESVNLWRRENDFVCLTFTRPSDLGEDLSSRGLQYLAQCQKATEFWNISMTITLDPQDSDYWPHGHVRDTENERPCKYIFCNDELPTFCRLLLKSSNFHDERNLRNMTIHIEVHDIIWKGDSKSIDHSLVGLSRMQKLLDPLRQLHSFGACQVEGSLSGSYKGDIIKSLCKDCPTAIDIIHTASEFLKQGDEQVDQNKNYSFRALKIYKVALSYVRSCHWLYEEGDFVMESGPFPRSKVGQAMLNLKTRLQARIASVYLNEGMLRMARIYTERALRTHHYYEHTVNTYDPLLYEPWHRVVFVEVLHVSAQIKYIHGNVREAFGEMIEAKGYVPLNVEQQRRYEVWKKHSESLDERSARRVKTRELQLDKKGEANEEKFLVVCNWKKKGDRLLRSGRSELAVSTYKAALSKIELLDRDQYWTIRSGIFEGYLIEDGIKALRFKLQTGVAASYLMSRRYEDLIQWTDDALRCCNPAWIHYSSDWRHVYRDDERDWSEDQRFDYARMYYCKAVALKHRGDGLGAIEGMEKALESDPGDGIAYAQLRLLRRELTEREDRLRKLNAHQIRLQKKQMARKGKRAG